MYEHILRILRSIYSYVCQDQMLLSTDGKIFADFSPHSPMYNSYKTLMAVNQNKKLCPVFACHVEFFDFASDAIHYHSAYFLKELSSAATAPLEKG
jgi:hypothetical protein